MEKILIGKDIIKTYGNGDKKFNALDSVSIEINSGEFVSIMGPSGCGKSTLLFALSGTDTIDSGTIEIDGSELSRLDEAKLADLRRTRIGFIFQQPTMLKNLNILDNIILPGYQENKKNISEYTKRALELMNKTGISGLESRDITEVSGGQLQRAGICRALVNEPKIIFADEPTGSLNSKSSEDIMALLSKINEDGTAILLVTHDSNVASKADRILFMKDGEIVEDLHFDMNTENRVEIINRQMAKLEI